MLDAPTLILALALDDLVLAAALWLAIPGKQRYGVAAWSASLALQALSFGFMWHGTPLVGSIGTILVVNAAGALSITLQLAALYALARRPFARMWHVAMVLANGMVSIALASHPAPRLIIVCLIIAGVLAIVAREARRIGRDIPGRGAPLVAAGALGGAVVFAARALAAAIMPDRVISVLQTPLSPITAFAGHAVTLAMSLGFLLLQRERQEHEIERLAMTDELTGVFNRRSLFELGDKEVARVRRTGASLSALLLDLDHFKRVNDKYGHLGGDAVLVRFVEVVRGCLRTSDLLARYGGEEFLVLLPDVGAAGAKVVGERIRSTIESSTFFIGAVPLKITASVGVAALAVGGEPSLASLVARSDAALYIAKRDGRNRVALAKAA
ncbi:MAG TPA: GGDEF domain-containing protein [Polyangia bacterium]|jgi:diguanylate cyclase (GGDEF)-like protein